MSTRANGNRREYFGAFIISKLVWDEDTLAALANAEERETRKSSTIMQCKEIFQEMKTEQNCRMTTPDNFANNKYSWTPAQLLRKGTGQVQVQTRLCPQPPPSHHNEVRE